MDPKDVTTVAARCLKDAAFAQEILEGKHNYPEVREAIINDIAEGIRQAMLKSTAPSHSQNFFHMFDPARNPSLLESYIKTGPKPGGLNLGKLAGSAACW